jgi:hypothetical protein
VGADGNACLAGDRDDVGQVVLALGVRVGDPGDGLRQEVAVEGVDPRVDLPDRRLDGVGLLLLHDGQHGAVHVPDDAAVAERVGDLAGEHGDRPAGGLVVGHQPGQRRALEQRGVAGRHHDGPRRRTP